MAAKISANRRKLRDELIIHRQKMLFFNKKIVLPTPICKINQLIQIDKKSKPSALWLAFFITMLTDYVAFSIGQCSFSYLMMIFAIKWTFGLAAIIVISSLVGCGALNIVLLRCKIETFNNLFLCLYKK